MLKVRISDDVIVEFIELFEKVRENKFAIGDRLINLVEMHGGDKASVINELAGNLNISASVLYDYYRTAEKWSPAMREIYQSLDWTFYRNTDPNDPEDLELLDRAIDESWNATTFKEQKYPSMKDPKTVFGKVMAMLTRGKKEWRPEIRAEIDSILERLEKLLRLYAS
jgi:hypothetical protein